MLTLFRIKPSTIVYVLLIQTIAPMSIIRLSTSECVGVSIKFQKVRAQNKH